MAITNVHPQAVSDGIEITGARVHNLRNIHVTMPHNRLTVITGLSGSGKSSLAFDTIFAEGQRRHMETFSSYARGYIGTMQRPDVDKITGLSPVISIDQKTTQRNPRSTVGTITEVYDYLRLLFARAATAYSYETGRRMEQMTDERIIEHIQRDYVDRKVMILAPLVKGRKGHYRELFDTYRKKGFVYVRVDGQLCELVNGMKVDRYTTHFIELVVDRLIIKQEENDVKRLRQSVDRAMTQGDGVILIWAPADDDKHLETSERYFSRHLMDPETGLSYAEPAPHAFSFNTPSGWCPCCKGLGKINRQRQQEDELDDIVHDDNEWLTRLMDYAQRDDDKDDDSRNEDWIECPVCHGKRLNREALSYRIADKNIAELCDMNISELLQWLHDLLSTTDSRLSAFDSRLSTIAHPIIHEISTRLQFMLSVGLGYLSLSRSSETLSGGESQRIRLATQIGSRLVNVLYILDEPSIGLHQRDNQRLIQALKRLRDLGNTVIVVEHDEQIMLQADWIIDIGPGAGRLGGNVVFQGTPRDLLRADTLTAKYLRHHAFSTSERKALPLVQTSPSLQGGPRKANIILRGCRGNNLKNIDVSFPLSSLIVVTGVSGSGKSSLVNQTLYPILSQRFYRSLTRPLPYDSIDLPDSVDKVIAVDQSPIGRTPRSNPATYTSVFTDIRELFAQLPEAKIRAWNSGRFSFNTKGGRCEQCSGNGYKAVRMHFLPDVYVPCEACGGKRYDSETLALRFKGKNIADILDMTVNQAVEFFDSQPLILRKIKTMQDVGLGYIKLGQAATTLSGGESQRLKLATYLLRPDTGNTVYMLDEPTTGLHFEDIRILMKVLRLLVDKGNTVIVIEHNLDVIRQADWIIDIGPEGGREGGYLVAEGTPDDIRHAPGSITAPFL